MSSPVVERPSEGMKGVSQRLFRGLASSYDRTVDYATFFQDRYWKRWVGEMTPDAKGGLALDIGCGTLLMEERLGARDWRFVGLDLSEEMLRSGRAKSLPHIVLLARGDAEALPFPEGMFDLVISCYVAKYVEVGRFVDEIARVTRPGATVVVYDFAKPKGKTAPFIELYIQAGLRAIGFLLALSRRDSAFTFSRLPTIVDGATWDSGFVRAMEERGFESMATERMTGGVVFAYCAKKRPSPYSRPEAG